MSWLAKISMSMSIPEALQELGFSSDTTPSPDELKKSWRKLLFEFHPDRNQGDDTKAKRINVAYQVLKDLDFSSPENFSGEENYPWSSPSPWGREVPDWQTDERSSYNEINEDSGRMNINFCKKEIWEYALDRGHLEEWTFWAFDGNYFRGIFTAKANEASLDFAGEVMEDWNSTGASSYATAAVFASNKSNINDPGPRDILLIRVDGYPVLEVFTHNSPNGNPGNDQEFMQELREYIQNPNMERTWRTKGEDR